MSNRPKDNKEKVESVFPVVDASTDMENNQNQALLGLAITAGMGNAGMVGPLAFGSLMQNENLASTDEENPYKK